MNKFVYWLNLLLMPLFVRPPYWKREYRKLKLSMTESSEVIKVALLRVEPA